MPYPGFAAHFTPTVHRDVYDAISPAHALAGAAAGLSVLVTGGGRGIGRAQAVAFAQAGARRVTVVARSKDELEGTRKAIAETAGKTEVVTVVGDVTSEEDVRRAFEQAGDVDVLVNTAGRLEGVKKIHESEVDDWWASYEVNIRGVYIPTRQALKNAIAKAAPGAPLHLTIVNTSSGGSACTMEGFSSYQAGKSAVNRFTEFLHFEYEDRGVRAFAYHPGGILTAMNLAALPAAWHPYMQDTVALAAGFALWLATQGADVDFLRGRFSSATWDVAELKALAPKIREKDLLWTRVVGQEQPAAPAA